MPANTSRVSFPTISLDSSSFFVSGTTALGTETLRFPGAETGAAVEGGNNEFDDAMGRLVDDDDDDDGIATESDGAGALASDGAPVARGVLDRPLLRCSTEPSGSRSVVGRFRRRSTWGDDEAMDEGTMCERMSVSVSVSVCVCLTMREMYLID